MLKKAILIVAAAAAIALAGCKQQSPVDQAIDIMHESTEQLQKAKNVDDAKEIVDETSAKIEKLHIDQQELTPEEREKLGDALLEYVNAAITAKAIQ